MAGLLGGLQSLLGYGTEEEDAKALEALRGASDVFKDIPLPELKALVLQNPQWLQDLAAPEIKDTADATFENAALERVGPTAFDNVSTDPRLKEQQLAALASLKEISDGGGMTMKDKANLNRVQSQTAQADAGRRDALMQGMARRGMGGSGMELLASLQSSQAATDRQSQEGLDIAGMAQERALNAMLQGGQLAGNVRGQDFGEQAQVAQARDSIAQFNAANSNNMSQFNAGKGLETQMFNIGKDADRNKSQAGLDMQAATHNNAGRQSVHGAGVQTQNQAAAHNNGMPQQQFQNQIAKAGGQAGAMGGIANYYQGQGDRKTDQFGNLISGGATIGAAALSDERAKKDKKPVEDVDLEMFMASIQPKKFKYKDEAAHGEGDRTGVMAQDLLKSKLGGEVAVQFDDGSLGYDKDKMQGVMLAGLKYLFDKIDGKKG
jgi:hypothetical protein